jgi:hypothetical protein
MPMTRVWPFGPRGNGIGWPTFEEIQRPENGWGTREEYVELPLPWQPFTRTVEVIPAYAISSYIPSMDQLIDPQTNEPDIDFVANWLLDPVVPHGEGNVSLPFAYCYQQHPTFDPEDSEANAGLGEIPNPISPLFILNLMLRDIQRVNDALSDAWIELEGLAGDLGIDPEDASAIDAAMCMTLVIWTMVAHHLRSVAIR